MGGHLGDNICEGGLVHAEGLEPLFDIPGAQDNPHPPGGAVPEMALNHLEVVPECPGIHGILDGLILIGRIKVSGQVQGIWQVWDAEGGQAWDNKLVAHRHECMRHNKPLPNQVWVGTSDVPQPLARVTQGDHQDSLKLPSLLA